MKTGLWAVFAAMLLNACGGDDSIVVTVESTFSSISTNILQEKCLSCHSSTTAASLGNGNVIETHTQVLTYVSPGSPNTSLFYTQVNSGSMPQNGSKLPEQHIEAIKTWIENGALDN